ncbi:MAG TPA: PDZ domain-containing protein [Actinomycetota bacterium]|jgi:Lon-like protease|nr:PDZ domain-containing protein [Actinomycetota bacterium]
MQFSDWERPDPPGVRPVRGVPLWRWAAAAGVCLVLGVVAFIVPIPGVYAYLPGPVRDVERLIEVDGAPTYSSEGSLFLTTVSVDTQITFAEWVGAGFDNTRTIVSRDAVTGGQSLDELRRRQQAEMSDSKMEAEVVALGALGLARPSGAGVRIVETVPESPAQGLLESGDRIVAVDGKKAPTTCDVGRLVDAHRPGEAISLRIVRDGRRRTVSVPAGEAPGAPGRPFLGIVMRDVNFSFEAPVEVDFVTGEIAGPSAALMFALTLYDRLTPDDLTGGRRIAGTGTLTCDGEIGPIGGIEQKIAGAEARGAEIFLAPEANATAARAVARSVRVVAVGTFSDALDYLQGLDS